MIRVCHEFVFLFLTLVEPTAFFLLFGAYYHRVQTRCYNLYRCYASVCGFLSNHQRVETRWYNLLRCFASTFVFLSNRQRVETRCCNLYRCYASACGITFVHSPGSNPVLQFAPMLRIWIWYYLVSSTGLKPGVTICSDVTHLHVVFYLITKGLKPVATICTDALHLHGVLPLFIHRVETRCYNLYRRSASALTIICSTLFVCRAVGSI